jgi:hypothetical protein
MTSKPSRTQPPPIRFPTSRDKGAFPFPTSQSIAQQIQAGADQPEELSAEELRLMADTMPGEGPGD